jgi:hypothetical protein
MTAPQLHWVLAGLALAGLLPPARIWAENEPAPYVQEHRPGRVVIEGGTSQGDTMSVALSGSLRVVLTVEGGAGLEVEPLRSVTSPDGWSVRSPVEPPRTDPAGNGRVRWQQEYTVEPIKPGELPLTLAPLRYREAAGEWRTIPWDAVPVQVTTEVGSADLKQLHDVREPIRLPEPPPWPRWPLGAAAVVLVLGLAAGLWLARRRRLPETPPLSPQAWALRELDRLQALNLPAQGEINRYHTLLSDVLRRYLELRFQLHAPRQTTAEFLRAVETGQQLTTTQQALLSDFLQRCDMAKFARAVPSAEECQAIADLARSFVVETGSPLSPAQQPA